MEEPEDPNSSPVEQLTALTDGEVVASISGDTISGFRDQPFFRILPRGQSRFGPSMPFGRRDQLVLAVQVAADGRGGTFAAWSVLSPTGATGTIWVSYRPPHGRFGAPHRVGLTDGELSIAAGGNRNAAIAWVVDGRVRVRLIRNGRLQRDPRILSPPQALASNILVGLGARAQTVVGWDETRPSARSSADVLQLAMGTPTGKFAPAGSFNVMDRTVVAPSLAVAPDGESIVAWTASGEGSDSSSIQAAVRPAGAARFEPPHRLSSPRTGTSSGATAAAGPKGKAVVLWDEQPLHCDTPTCVANRTTVLADIYSFNNPPHAR